MKNFNKRISITLVIVLVLTLSVPMAGFANESALNLGTADSFAVLAGSTITNTGTTIITGDVGLDPGTAFTGQSSVTMIDGSIYIDDGVALDAKTDLQAAYTDAAGRVSNTIGAELGGTTLTPGVYGSNTSLDLTGTLTLDAQNTTDAVFILQADSTLTTASNSTVELINGATAENVFWQVGSSATLGTNSEFAGTILASESITATTGADIEGQLLALNGAVTLDSNTITNYTPGSLTVQKTVSGDTGDITLPEFEITVTGPDGFSSTRTYDDNESITWENLVPGEYTVTESRTGLDDEWTVSGEGTVQVISGESHSVTINNAYSTTTGPVGSLTVDKSVVGDIGDMTLPVFEMTVTGPDGFSSTRTLVNNETYTWENLAPGEYTVTENRTGLDDEWTVSGEGTVQVVADGAHSATITNTYSTTAGPVGSLTVGKTVVGDVGNRTLPVFEMTVTGPDGFSSTRTLVNNETYTWENLAPGEYDVTESRTGLSTRWRVSGEGTVQVVADESNAVTITNLYRTPTDTTSDDGDSEDSTPEDSTPVESSVGSLTVEKNVIGDTGDMTLPAFEITVTGPDGFASTRTFVDNESYTWENLEPGEYIVTEDRTGLSSEWTVSGEGTIQVVGDGSHLATITNAYVEAVEPVGSLTVGNSVTGDTGDMTLPVFEMTVTGPEGFSSTRTFVDNETYTWENLVPGEYNVTENRTGLSSEWTVSGEGTVQVDADQTQDATVVNNYEQVEPLPQTGQQTNNNRAFLFGSIAAIIAGLGISLEIKKKRLNE